MDEAEWRLMAEVARRFYLVDESKTDLAARLSISRFRVARLLQQARDNGVVTIEINDRDAERRDLSHQLAEHLRLADCVVVDAGDTEDATRRRIARAAAAHVSRQVRDGDLVGLSWGRTLVALAEEMDRLPPCTLVQLTGTVGTDVGQSPLEVLRRIATRSRAETVAVFCPLFASSARTARSWRSDPAISRALGLYDRLDLAVVAVGSWDPPITQVAEYASDSDRAELERASTRAEIAGVFLRDDGRTVDAALAERRISVSAEQLARTPRVVAVAGTVEKAPAIAAASRSGLLTGLVTDDRTAHALLRLPAVSDVALALRGTVAARRPAGA